MNLRALARTGPVHFMGIGGAGMYPLAEWLLREGGQVSGCDSVQSEATRRLEELGARIDIGHAAEHADAAVAVVVTAAVPASHPELARARERGIPVVKRAAALAALVNPGRVVAIAGTHGKTSTTALTVEVLSAAGMDPTGFVGGHVAAWDGNLRRGASDLAVVEADEFDRSFHHLTPDVAVVTNLEADHLDIYGNLEGVRAAFATFVGGMREGGHLIVCGDDPEAARLLALTPTGYSYGVSAGCQLRAVDVEVHGARTRFRLVEDGVEQGVAEIRGAGLHTVRNALAAAAVARTLGAEWASIKQGLAAHRGVERRFQCLGEAGDVVVIDDYAHHPTEISATLAAARSAYAGRRIVAVFQPHLFSRTHDFATEFGQSLAAADEVWVSAIYPAREAPIEGVKAGLVSDAVAAAKGSVVQHDELATLPEHLSETLRPGDVVVVMGAGSVAQVAPELLTRLETRVAQGVN